MQQSNTSNQPTSKYGVNFHRLSILETLCNPTNRKYTAKPLKTYVRYRQPTSNTSTMGQQHPAHFLDGVRLELPPADVICKGGEIAIWGEFGCVYDQNMTCMSYTDGMHTAVLPQIHSCRLSLKHEGDYGISVTVYYKRRKC
jgi:hypothetical protein